MNNDNLQGQTPDGPPLRRRVFIALGLAILAVAAMVLWAGTQAPAGAQGAPSGNVSEGPGTVATATVTQPPTAASLPGETATAPAPADAPPPAASVQADP